MSFDWQDIIVYAVVLAALSFVVRRIMRRSERSNPCDGCSGCNPCKHDNADTCGRRHDTGQ